MTTTISPPATVNAPGITGGVATVYVSDLDQSMKFYTEVLGLQSVFLSAGKWGQARAPDGTSIGLHPMSPKAPKPGISGSISIGFMVGGPIDQAVSRLKAQGVKFRGPVVSDGPIKLAFFGDPDGNDLYLASYS